MTFASETDSECKCKLGSYLTLDGSCEPCFKKFEGDYGVSCRALGEPPQLFPGYHSKPLKQVVDDGAAL